MDTRESPSLYVIPLTFLRGPPDSKTSTRSTMVSSPSPLTMTSTEGYLDMTRPELKVAYRPPKTTVISGFRLFTSMLVRAAFLPDMERPENPTTSGSSRRTQSTVSSIE